MTRIFPHASRCLYANLACPAKNFDQQCDPGTAREFEMGYQGLLRLYDALMDAVELVAARRRSRLP